MSDSRTEHSVCVRLDEDEMEAIKTRALALNMNKSELVRTAIWGLINHTSTSEKINKAIDELRVEIAAEIRGQAASIEKKQYRTTLLLLRTLKAPKEAEAGLDAIFGGQYESQKN